MLSAIELMIARYRLIVWRSVSKYICSIFNNDIMINKVWRNNTSMFWEFELSYSIIMMSEEVCSVSIKETDTLRSCVCFKFDNGGSSTAKVITSAALLRRPGLTSLLSYYDMWSNIAEIYFPYIIWCCKGKIYNFG